MRSCRKGHGRVNMEVGGRERIVKYNRESRRGGEMGGQEGGQASGEDG